MPRYDVLALDIDGTLLNSDKRLHARDAEAVKRAADAGVRLVLCTARPPRSTRPILHTLGLLPASAIPARSRSSYPPPKVVGATPPAPPIPWEALDETSEHPAIKEDEPPAVDPGHVVTAGHVGTPVYDTAPIPPGHHITINYNGALTWDMASGHALDHIPIDPMLARAVITVARTVNPGVLVWVEIMDRWCTDRPFDAAAKRAGLGTETSKTHPPDLVAPFRDFLHEAPTKIMFLAEPSRLMPVHDRVRRRFDSPGLLACKVSDEHLFSVCSAKADKGAALARLCGRLDVPRDRVLAIGDAPNDTFMLEWAGRGLAVANAWADARIAADLILPYSNDQCAVAEVIEREVLV